MWRRHAAVAPRADDFDSLLGRTSELKRCDYAWRDEPARPGVPPLVLFANHDDAFPYYLSVSTGHLVESAMRTLKIIEHVSLDGVVQHSADGGDFPYSGWINPYRTPAGLDAVLAAQGARFDLLLGRRTYDLWSVAWGQAPRGPMADPINAATKYVATHRPESLAWGPCEAVGPDVVAGVRRLKAQDGPGLGLWGSSALTSTLLAHGLADEVVLVVYPVLLRTGKRVFAEGTPARAFELVGTRALPSGVILSTYTAAGPLKTG